jgi:succinate dehydrogenase/fumarate reductase flavoprotein subunit
MSGAGVRSDEEGAPPDYEADVVVVGAGGAGLPAAISAVDAGASVIVVEANHDIGGHAMLSGGRVPLGGGTSWQKRFGVADSPEQVFLDHTNHKVASFKYADRDLVRTWAYENAPTFEFLLENDVRFIDAPPETTNAGTVPRLFYTMPFSDDLRETINGRGGSGIVRALERSARAKGVRFLLRHTLTGLIATRTPPRGVRGIAARGEEGDVTVRAHRGVVLATGGHTSNVAFRRMFDPRLTEEYQTVGEPWSRQSADGERLAMELGAALWGTSSQAGGRSLAIAKTFHIGCRYGYLNLKWRPDSPMFGLAGASGLTVKDFQDVILVNQFGERFWNELDESSEFFDACLGPHRALDRADGAANGGGPIWAIFDSDAVQREGWDPRPPNVDPDGWFFTASTIAGLAGRIVNPYQRMPLSPGRLEDSVARYNACVDAGIDTDFGKPGPRYKIQSPPFYAAWATPMLHDSLTGLHIDTRCRVIDTRGEVIPGLYCAGESAGGFGLHGIPRVLVFGRIAGREAATSKS